MSSTFLQIIKCRNDQNFDGVKVARLPPVMAQHTEGRGWVLESENEPHVSFYGAYVDLNVCAFPLQL